MKAITALKTLKNSNITIAKSRRYLASKCTTNTTKAAEEIVISRKCWKCGFEICQGCTLFCSSSSCEAIQGLDIEACNLFSLFGVKEAFVIDDNHLEASFKNLQRQLHPDKFAMKSIEERERSSNNSSIVNQAYQVRLKPTHIIVLQFFFFCDFHSLYPTVLILHGYTLSIATRYSDAEVSS